MNAPAPMLRGRVRHAEPMARHTTWRAGGPAALWYRPVDLDDLVTFMRSLPADLPVLWAGLGSNLLVRDGGFPGAVVVTAKALTTLDVSADGSVHAQAGVPCAQLAKACAAAGLGGAEFMAGIPGTVGGALAMNAGAHGQETWPLVVRLRTLDRAGAVHVRTPADFAVGYRSVRLRAANEAGTGKAEASPTPSPTQEWFLDAELRLTPDDPAAVQARMHTLLRQRAATQPLRQPNAGSVFRNPPGDYAGRLVEAAGCKGLRVGGAQVSTVHANFIVNAGDARAADVETLIAQVRARVLAHAGVDLEPEVRIVGVPA